MPVNPRFLLFGLILSCILSGCGLVAVTETPESWGASGGSYGAEQWVEVEKNKSWPTAESLALFCVSIAEQGQKKFNWTFAQQLKSTTACNRAFVDGLK
jgi:uncharacterized protein YceK